MTGGYFKKLAGIYRLLINDKISTESKKNINTCTIQDDSPSCPSMLIPIFHLIMNLSKN